MADAISAAFSYEGAALFIPLGTTDIGMLELLFMAQVVRNPLQAIARRWWCRSLFRATRGQRRCPEYPKS
jgi:hypothetical protein